MIPDGARRGAAHRRILLIEDSPSDARLVELMLEQEPGHLFELTHVDTLDRAREHLSTTDVGCVLADLNLPDGDGLEVVERIRDAGPDLPIIVLTGRDDIAVAVSALQSGAQDYLIKGRVDGQLLLRSLRYAVEHKHSELQLVYQAMHDQLTGLPNRALFIDRLEQSLVRNDRHPSLSAVMFIDVDRFKMVNDSLGHAAGDLVLIALGERLRALLRPSDTVARFGGDEFTVLCTDLQDEQEAFAIASRIQEALIEPIDLDGAALVLTVSIGIALAVGPHDQATTLVRNADAAMYRAKERGGASSLLFDDAIHRRAVHRLETEVALRRSLDRGDFELFYQPMVEADGCQLAGFEALVRWRHPTRGLVGPAEFIALAEETGLIERLGEWVLGEACSQARRWWDLRGQRDPLITSVNVSARQLAGDGITDLVRTVLAANGLPPQALCLEITESALIRDVDATCHALRELNALGVRLAVDDFGTGYTTLRNLKRFPVDLIKVDGSFISGLAHDREDIAITMAVIRLARALGLRTVAEGVETAEQMDLLRTLGCDLVQGFHIGRPAPVDATAARWVEVA